MKEQNLYNFFSNNFEVKEKIDFRIKMNFQIKYLSKLMNKKKFFTLFNEENASFKHFFKKVLEF
jgi:hypothetical protein